MKIVTDSNGNNVRVNDDGNMATIPYQFVMNLSMNQERTATSIRFSNKECPINSDGIIDYTQQYLIKNQSINVPMSALSNLSTEEIATFVSVVRKLYDAGIENSVNPPVVEVL